MFLEPIFKDLVSKYSGTISNADVLWNEIKMHYTDENRYYHNLSHLDNLYKELLQIKKDVKNWDVMLFTLFYHDIVYDAKKSDNEEQSASLAVDRMKVLRVPEDLMLACQEQIVATKSHVKSDDEDTNYFTDADLSILGASWEKYLEYTENVRSEYAVYPEIIYTKGRKHVLRHFLNMGRIYKTDFFYQIYEENAKLNIQRELNLLSK